MSIQNRSLLLPLTANKFGRYIPSQTIPIGRFWQFLSEREIKVRPLCVSTPPLTRRLRVQAQLGAVIVNTDWQPDRI